METKIIGLRERESIRKNNTTSLAQIWWGRRTVALKNVPSILSCKTGRCPAASESWRACWFSSGWSQPVEIAWDEAWEWQAGWTTAAVYWRSNTRSRSFHQLQPKKEIDKNLNPFQVKYSWILKLELHSLQHGSCTECSTFSAPIHHFNE